MTAGLCWLWVGHRAGEWRGAHGVVNRSGHYTPGVATAPLLFAVALYVARQLRHDERERHRLPANPV